VKSRLSLINNFNADKFGSNSNIILKSSRLLKEINPELLDQAQTFLKSNITKRLDIVKKLVEEISKEKKTKQDAIDFVNTVLAVLYSNTKPNKENMAKYEAIETARNYLNDRAPSVKMLLEYVALNV